MSSIDQDEELSLPQFDTDKEYSNLPLIGIAGRPNV